MGKSGGGPIRAGPRGTERAILRASRIKLYETRAELVHLAWPLFLVGLLAYWRFQNWPQPPRRLLHWGYFIAGTLFLNIVHNGFTFFAVAWMPELRQLVRERSKGSMLSWPQRWALLFPVLVVFFYFALSGLLKFSPTFDRLAQMLLSFIALHHVVKQQMGISLLYNGALLRARALSPEELGRCRRAERRERILFGLILVALFLSPFLLVFRDSVPAGLLQFAGGLNSWIFVLAALTVVNSLTVPFAAFSNKAVFNLRSFVYGLVGLTPLAAVAVGCIHGMEYYFVFRKMVTASARQFSRRSALALAGVSVFLVALYLAEPTRGLGWIVMRRFHDHLAILNGIAAVSLALSYLHYYMDRQLFQLSQPANREHLGVLLR